MSIPLMVTLVVLIGCLVPVAIVWMRVQARRERAMLAAQRADGPLLDRLAAAERRIAALEAIATDPARPLARAIEDLAA